ncbi:guanyl-nucleotide exchange factor [Teratosphaeria destructans]|uniref:Guanyl-nucleotide exchange factor n=1 Tax=Teratosphaeria destructans TaxID=418781 RepID=A0A9W7SNS1_9PEZI|nr:guanyl-nucleotide exchange factor [Teratosphaeria destructans]
MSRSQIIYATGFNAFSQLCIDTKEDIRTFQPLSLPPECTADAEPEILYACWSTTLVTNARRNAIWGLGHQSLEQDVTALSRNPKAPCSIAPGGVIGDHDGLIGALNDRGGVMWVRAGTGVNEGAQSTSAVPAHQRKRKCLTYFPRQDRPSLRWIVAAGNGKVVAICRPSQPEPNQTPQTSEDECHIAEYMDVEHFKNWYETPSLHPWNNPLPVKDVHEADSDGAVSDFDHQSHVNAKRHVNSPGVNGISSELPVKSIEIKIDASNQHVKSTHRAGASSADLEQQAQTFTVSGTPKQLVANTGNFFLLTRAGEVHSWGDPRHQTLGRPIAESPADQPGIIEVLQGLRITKLASGGWTSAALSEDGALYLWGAASMPGHKDAGIKCLREADAGEMVLVEIPGDDGEPADVLDVAVGEGHVAVVTAHAGGNRLYVVGQNRNGQLGLGSDQAFLEDWVEVDVMRGLERVVCGPKCTFAVRPSDSKAIS